MIPVRVHLGTLGKVCWFCCFCLALLVTVADGLQPFLQGKGLCSLGRVQPIAETEMPIDHLGNIKTLTGSLDSYFPLFFPALEACQALSVEPGVCPGQPMCPDPSSPPWLNIGDQIILSWVLKIRAGNDIKEDLGPFLMLFPTRNPPMPLNSVTHILAR